MGYYALAILLIVVIIICGVVLITEIKSDANSVSAAKSAYYDSTKYEAICCNDQAQPTLWRFYDDGLGVMCWIYASGSAGGISCVPDHETKLGNN